MESISSEIIIDSLENGFFIMDEACIVFTWNRWLELKTGISRESIINGSLETFFPELDYKNLRRKINTALFLRSPSFYHSLSGKQFMQLKRFKVTDKVGEYMYLNVVISPYIVEEKKVMVSIYDVSELHDLQIALQNEMAVVQSLYQELQRDKLTMEKTLIMLKTDINGHILDASDAMCDFFGYSKAELIGKKASVFRDPKMPSSLFNELWETISHKVSWRGEVKNVAKDGTSRWMEITIIPIIENETILHYIGIYNDIRDKKKIERLAVTDPLTKLYNRGYFNKVFEQSITNTKRNQDQLTVIIVDIDHFKGVNDSYGHQTGDVVLVRIASLLKETLRDGDVLARWGGEEFAVLLNIDTVNGRLIAEKLRAAVEKLAIPGIPNITCSFGVTGCQREDTAASVFKRADDALYLAKNNGRNRIEGQ